MRRREIEEKLALLVDVIRVPRAQLTIEQLSKQRSTVNPIYLLKISITQLHQVLHTNRLNNKLSANYVHRRWLHSWDETTSSIKCARILTRIPSPSASLCCTALVVQEKVNWHLNSSNSANPNGKFPSVIWRLVIY